MKTTENYLIKSRDNRLKIKRVIETIDHGNLPLIPEATPENLKKISWLDDKFLSDKQELEIVVQLFVIESNNKIIIIDTCIGNHKDLTYKPWANRQSMFLDKIREAGVDQTKVDYVVCTHIHLDHVGWNTTKVNNVWETTFPNASYIFSEKEFQHAKKFENKLHGNIIEESINPVIRRGQATFINPPYSIDNNITIIPTPGHTPGHVSVVINYDHLNIIITGDTIHHPCQIACPEWNSYYEFDQDLSIKTRRRILEKNAGQNSMIIGSHFPGSSFGKIIKDGDKYTFDILCDNYEQKN